MNDVTPLKPAAGVKLSRIEALDSDLSLALAARTLRIEAPVPGKSVVGIEVPNLSIGMVTLKDVAESDYTGRDYPFSRCFDYWHGHSWAKGLVESADGKDQESTSEDGFASFAIKMWGKVVGDANMEKRGASIGFHFSSLDKKRGLDRK